MKNTKKKIRILSIDGGGIRGIIPGTILFYLEQELKSRSGNQDAKIGQYFDLIVGTSTGGILSLLYCCPDDNGMHKYGAKDALGLYMDLGENIFKLTLHQQIKSLKGIINEKYSELELENALQQFLGDIRLSQSIRPCLITSYDIQNRLSFFFSSLDAKSQVYDFLMKDVGRATSAAPTYFEAANIKSMLGTPYTLVDGGVFANNPALCAYAEARTINFSEVLNDTQKPDKPGAKNMLLVSIGTGSVKRPYTYAKYKDAGVVEWIKPLIDIMMSGNAETVDYQLRKIFETLSQKDCSDYYRIQPKLIRSLPDMDLANKENLIALQGDGFSSVADNKTALDEIVGKLLDNA